jgi:rhodanese-related sulfurtransferase
LDATGAGRDSGGMTNASTITRSELQDAIAAGAVVVVETLGPMYYESGHLPGAINIPHTQVAELAAELLPDRDAAIVTYCSNPQCQNSSAVQAQLRSLGYTDVRKYTEGKDDWSAAGLPLTAGAVA